MTGTRGKLIWAAAILAAIILATVAGVSRAAASADTTPPVLDSVTPTGTLDYMPDTITVNYSDAESGIDPLGVGLTVSDPAYLEGCTHDTTHISCQLKQVWWNYPYTFEVQVTDMAGNLTDQTFSFSPVDTDPPQVLGIEPLGIIDHSPTELRIYVSDATSGFQTPTMGMPPVNIHIEPADAAIDYCVYNTGGYLQCPIYRPGYLYGTDLPWNQTYTFSGSFADIAGNWTDFSGSFTPDDHEAPIVTVQPQGTFHYLPGGISITGYDMQSGISNITFSIDNGASLASCFGIPTTDEYGNKTVQLDWQCTASGIEWGKTYHVTGDATDVAGNVNSYDVSFTPTPCSKPQLSLSLDGAAWQSFANYLERRLTASYTIQNTGTENAYNARITGSNNTGEVSTLTAMPAPLLAIMGPGDSSTVSIDYQVPDSLANFRATLSGEAWDDCSSLHTYP